jgi:hypothetical protein
MKKRKEETCHRDSRRSTLARQKQNRVEMLGGAKKATRRRSERSRLLKRQEENWSALGLSTSRRMGRAQPRKRLDDEAKEGDCGRHTCSPHSKPGIQRRSSQESDSKTKRRLLAEAHLFASFKTGHVTSVEPRKRLDDSMTKRKRRQEHWSAAHRRTGIADNQCSAASGNRVHRGIPGSRP